MSDLELIETNDLVAEICKRYECVVIFAKTLQTDTLSQLHLTIHGDLFACETMAGVLKDRALMAINESLERLDG